MMSSFGNLRMPVGRPLYGSQLPYRGIQAAPMTGSATDMYKLNYQPPVPQNGSQYPFTDFQDRNLMPPNTNNNAGFGLDTGDFVPQGMDVSSAMPQYQQQQPIPSSLGRPQAPQISMGESWDNFKYNAGSLAQEYGQKASDSMPWNRGDTDVLARQANISPEALANFHTQTNGLYQGIGQENVQGFMGFLNQQGVDPSQLTKDQMAHSYQAWNSQQKAHDQFGTTGMDWANIAVKGASAAWQMYNSHKQMKLADQNFKEMRALNRANFANNAKTVNSEYRDQQSGRGNAVMSQSQKSALGRQYKKRELALTY